jgi:2-C-methyl-D-erythritol 4-phosphate cytidylyltransferase
MAVALIVAAGLGERLGASRPKALVEVAGRPLVQWSMDTLAGVPAIERIVVALPAGIEVPAGTVGLLGGATLEVSIGLPSSPAAIAVTGGATRSESVRLALAAAGDGLDSDLVLVHDAARPLFTAELVQATLAAVESEGVDAAIAAVPVTDTIKQADGEGVVTQTLDRAVLWAVQTPQVFRRSALERALDVPDEVLVQATDDAWLMERAGGRVVVVPAPPENIKVTTPFDLELAELLLTRRRA